MGKLFHNDKKIPPFNYCASKAAIYFNLMIQLELARQVSPRRWWFRLEVPMLSSRSQVEEEVSQCDSLA